MKNQQKSAVTSILIIAVLAIGYFGTYGQWTKLAESNLALENAEKKNQELQKAKSDATAFVSRINSADQEIVLANKALPVGDPDTAILLDNYATMVRNSGLSLVQLGIVDPPAELEGTPNTIMPLDIDLMVSGSYEGFKNFLLLVQRNIRISDVISVTIDSSEDSQDGRSLDFTLKIRVYYQQ